MAVRILIADDHKLVRDGLRTLLGKQLDFEVVAEAEDGVSTVDLAAELKPDVVLMDVGMKGMNGVEATRTLLSATPAVKVLALSMHAESRFVREMLAAGAVGYVHKDCAFGELAQAIREVMEGKTYLSPQAAEAAMKDYVEQVAPKAGGSLAPKVPALSPRERQVLQMLAEGRSARDVSQLLHLSVKTVETHRRQIMAKLGIHSIAELTKYAIREGLTSYE